MDNDVVKRFGKLAPTKAIMGESGSNSNALSHGLSPRSPVVKTAFYQESEDDFKKILEDLRSAFAPQGDFEEELVRGLAYDVHCRKRGELYENATVRHNEEERIRQLEDEPGIPALKENIEAAEILRDACKRDVEELSRIPEDIAQAAESDFEKHRDALRIIYDVIFESAELHAKLAMERAWRLGRFHLVLRENYLFKPSPAQIRLFVLQTKEAALQRVGAELDRMHSELRSKKREHKKLMSQNCLRCLLPNKEDLEALDRFYSMHDRNIRKTTELLMKLQFARVNGLRLMEFKSLPGNGKGSSELHPQAHSVAPVGQQSTTKEGEDHVA